MKCYFDISCHALIGTAFFALALTGRLDFLSIAAFTPVFFASLYRTARALPPWLTPRGAFYLSCAYVAVFLADLAVLSGTVIASAVHMVLFLEMAKLHQEKSDRDYFYLISLAFVKILAASSLTIDITFVVTLLLFITAMVSTLIGFEMYRGERASQQPAGRAPALPIGGLSAWATLWIVVLGAGIFFVIPRFGTNYFTRAAIPPLLISGFNDDVRLGQIGDLKLNSAVVMHAKRLPDTGLSVLKWRGVALDTFDGFTWFKRNRTRTAVRAEDSRYLFHREPVRGETANYEILLEPLATTALFGPHRIRQISGRAIPGLEVDDGGSIYTRFQQPRRLQYRVQSEIARRSDAKGGSEDEEDFTDAQRSAYLQLPRQLDARIRDLALRIVADAKTDEEKASRVEAHLKANYRYSLTLDWDPGKQPLSSFLFTAKSGHCEYFASAMAVMLRTAGVPTRLVNGFLMGEYNPVGDAYIVRQSDAHSWVEVYLPGRGWTEFDPTPPDNRSPATGFFAQFGHYADAAGLFWNTYILTYDTDTQAQLFNSAQESVQKIQTSAQTKTEILTMWVERLSGRFSQSLRAMFRSGWIWIAAIGGLALIAGYRNRSDLWIRWRLFRTQSSQNDVDGRVVEALFYRAARLAENAEKGVRSRENAQTWREWIGRLPNEQRRSILTRAVEVFERSKYGRQSASTSDIALLQQAVRDLRGLLQ